MVTLERVNAGPAQFRRHEPDAAMSCADDAAIAQCVLADAVVADGAAQSDLRAPCLLLRTRRYRRRRSPADPEVGAPCQSARRGSTPLCRLATAPRDASAARRGRPVRPAMRRFPCHHRRHGDGRPRRNPGAIAPTARSLLRSIASAWRSPSAASRCASSPLHFWPPSAKRRTRRLTLDPCKPGPEGEGRLSRRGMGIADIAGESAGFIREPCQPYRLRSRTGPSS